jgi:hyperosmotically inducible periplasmic protein
MRTTTTIAAATLFGVFSVSSALGQTPASTAAASAAPVSKKEIRKRDWHTENAIHKAFAKTKGLDSTGIVVVARPNAITLSGVVPEDTQIQLAYDAAKTVAKSTPVVNNITVLEHGQ